MNIFNSEVLDAPVHLSRRLATWARLAALGMIGILMSIAIRLQYIGFFSGEIDAAIYHMMDIPSWIYMPARISAFATLLGVILTVIRKEPDSFFRSIVISTGMILLLALGLFMRVLFHG